MKILCVAGSRGERARLAPLVASLEGDHAVTAAQASRAGEVPSWDAGARPPQGLSLEMREATPALRVAAALRWMEPLLQELRPDIMLVCGESEVALGAAFAAGLAQVAVAHLDAGLMPDRANPNGRLLDQAAAFLIAPHVTAVQRLAALGMEQWAAMCGDTLADSPPVTQTANLPRPATEAPCVCYLGGPTLESPQAPAVFAALERLGLGVLMPAAPRTRSALVAMGVAASERVQVVEPLDYAPMQQAVAAAPLIITDSPTLQREAYFRGTVAVGLAAADFPDGESSGWVRPVPLEEQAILAAAQAPPPRPPNLESHRGASSRAAQFLTGL